MGDQLFTATRSRARTNQKVAYTLFGALTYFVLACAAYIFLFLIWKGVGAINWEFLTGSPETLHVFTDESLREEIKEQNPENPEEFRRELSDQDYEKFKEARGEKMATPEELEGLTGQERINKLRAIGAKGIENHDTYNYAAGGIFPAIVGTVLLVSGCIIIAMLLGVSAAIYLSEYSKDSKFIRMIRLAILNLSGVPSIVFGLFGYAMLVLAAPIFVQELNLHPRSLLSFPVPYKDYYLSFQGWGVSMLSGCFTLAFMILPVVITASEESLRSVPKGFRDGSLALGATKWQTIRKNVLPYAFPGILTSSILGITRVAGETAPIMFTACFVIVSNLPWEKAGAPTSLSDCVGNKWYTESVVGKGDTAEAAMENAKEQAIRKVVASKISTGSELLQNAGDNVLGAFEPSKKVLVREGAAMSEAGGYVADVDVAVGLYQEKSMLMKGVMALPYHIYVLAAKIPQSTFTENAQYGSVLVFLVIVLVLALLSIFMRIKVRKKYKW